MDIYNNQFVTTIVHSVDVPDELIVHPLGSAIIELRTYVWDGVASCCLS